MISEGRGRSMIAWWFGLILACAALWAGLIAAGWYLWRWLG